MVDQHAANDGFVTYFTEKLWEMVPMVYRMEDTAPEAVSPGALRALIEAIAEQAAVLRRSQDRLWDDQFIELADDWVVPYLADLVGTRLVSAQNKAGRRADVAKTIYYRRRKGTLAVLEELIVDIARWDGKVVEAFRRLARARHRLDPPAQLGRFSLTPAGGTADLRSALGASLVGGPSDEYHRTPDVRRPQGTDGRYGINKLLFHLHRIPAQRVQGVTPKLISGSNGFVFDPSGRDMQLFVPGDRVADWSAWTTAEPWELPMPLTRPLLDQSEFLITEGLVRTLIADAGLSAASAADLRSIRDVSFRNEERLHETLASLPSSAELLGALVYPKIVELALTADSAKAHLLRGPDGPTGREALVMQESNRGIVSARETASGRLGTWASGDTEHRAIVDPVRGRLLFTSGPDGEVSVDYCYGFPAGVGAGTYDRRQCLAENPNIFVSGGGTMLDADSILNHGICEVQDSRTYEPVSDKLVVRDLTVQAANGQRPYLLPGANWVLNAGGNKDAHATLDGLWVGGTGGELIFHAERDGATGSYECVTIRHCTLDPGGTAADGSKIENVDVFIGCRIKELVIDHSIVGPVRVIDTGAIEKLVVRDSIIQSDDPATPAIDLPMGEAHLDRVTVLGDAHVHKLWASNSVIAGSVSIDDTQEGCFRFSAAPTGSILPSPYECVALADLAGLFASTRFGDAEYAQLSQSALNDVQQGAENESEMGAYSGLNNHIKLEGLLAKVEEYAPFGMLPVPIFET